MTDVTPRTADLTDILSGRSFPTDTVDVYLDEKAAYLVFTLNNDIRASQARNEDTTELEAERDKIAKAAEDTKRVFHLRGVSRKAQEDAVEVTFAKHPQEYDAFGRPRPNFEGDRKMAALTWALYVQKIVMPDGSELVAPSEEMMALFRGEAPDFAVKTVDQAIDSLRGGAARGFEAIVQDHDFLSRR